MLEESIYWHIIHERWVTEEGWTVYRPIFEALFPPVVGKVVPAMIRRRVIKAIRAQGLGRHPPEEILEMGKADISALAALLGDKPFLLGEQPTSFDAAVYAFLANILVFPVDSPLRRFMQEQRPWSATSSASSSASSGTGARPPPERPQARRRFRRTTTVRLRMKSASPPHHGDGQQVLRASEARRHPVDALGEEVPEPHQQRRAEAQRQRVPEEEGAGAHALHRRHREDEHAQHGHVPPDEDHLAAVLLVEPGDAPAALGGEQPAESTAARRPWGPACAPCGTAAGLR